jgi:hypothetical protein
MEHGAMLRWERLNCDHGPARSAYRAKVPGGWLVAYDNGMTFVPDPEHQWDGNSLE